MAGIDAPSLDLTARIQATRKQMVLRGELDPMKPGEHSIHGRAPGGSIDVDAIGRAQDARARRATSTGGDRVVEMDYEDYKGTQPGTKELLDAADADEEFDIDGGFDLGEDDGQLSLDAPEPEEAPEQPVRRRRREVVAEVAVSTPDDVLVLLEEVVKMQEAWTAEVAALGARLDGLGVGLVALADGIGTQLAAITELLREQEPDTVAEEPVPVVEPKKPLWRYVFGSASGPYE